MRYWLLSGCMILGLAACQQAARSPYEGTLTDARDGQTYRTRLVGSLEWMMENLRFVADSSWCVPQDSGCTTGRLYAWDVAMRACPAGWRLPTVGEVGDFVERFSPGWRVSEGGARQAFHALEPLLQPAGFYQSWTHRFVDFGEAATLWTSDPFGLSAAMGLVWSKVHQTVEITPLSKEAGHACRCVRPASGSAKR